MNRKILICGAGLVVTLLLIILLLVPTTFRQPRYVSTYEGKFLTCGDTYNNILGATKVSFAENGRVLHLQINGQQLELKFAGGDFISDHYVGGSGAKVEIDPEFKHSQIFGNSGGLCD